MRHLLLLTLVFCTGVCFAAADDETYGNVTVTEITSIYDGDTFRATIADWPPIVGNRIAVRVKGIDTPELKGRCEQEKALARKAKQATVNMIRSGRKIELRNLQRDKYFRLLADVFVDDKNLAAMLTAQGLARTYHGGTKSSWCPAPGIKTSPAR